LRRALSVIEFVDHSQLHGLALGVGQGAKGVGKLGFLSARIDLRFQLGEVVEVVIELDAEPTAHLKFCSPAAVVRRTRLRAIPNNHAAACSSLVPRNR
jgi:hypothetical protein